MPYLLTAMMSPSIPRTESGQTMGTAVPRAEPLMRTEMSPRQVRGSSRSRGLVLTVVLAGLMLVGCAGDADDQIVAPVPSSTERQTLTTETSASERTSDSDGKESTLEEEIIARYHAFWEARFEANQAPVNPDHPGLREYATGDQLETAVAGIRQNEAEGLAVRRPEDSGRRSEVQVVSVDGDQATVQECFVDDGVVYRVESGEVINDSVATHNVRGAMERVDGEWRLSSSSLVQRWEGVAGCALSSGF